AAEPAGWALAHAPAPGLPVQGQARARRRRADRGLGAARRVGAHPSLPRQAGTARRSHRPTRFGPTRPGDPLMPGIPFHETRMGHQFLTKTAPEGVRELRRLADAVERLNGFLEQLLAARGIPAGAEAPRADP